MEAFIVAGVLAVAALVLFVIGRSLRSKVAEISGTETSSAASIAELASAVAKDIGAGSFADRVEVKGKAVALEPLTADFSGTAVVWYECVVTRQWEEEYWETDKDGNRHRRTRSGTDTVSSIRREPLFEIDDGSGRIAVDPRGAQLEAENSWSSFEAAGAGRSSMTVGSFVFNALAAAGGRRTIGYRFTERSIPVGRELYVLGSASDQGGRLRIVKPEKGRFIVSTRSEEAIVKGSKTGILWLDISSGLAAAGAVVALAVGLFRAL
jgi:hypothetical protein